ncbi:alcohol dehydrogenase catalytic domain-containing protein [Nitriliruptor alkaliphilus]|uniref:alcohol dehydrogenase catalytic domain-containing protein n=1 Tax=Nitriliruptor alkaliphilus TaxID=427918 RepID=UPI001FDF45C9|nr:alcohol dehydrogenase catalytic domain-containing protein [Nitriliruptor alkaliphilus]
MKAVMLHGPGDVRVDELPMPEIVDPTDAILRVTNTAICGTDLHCLHGGIPAAQSDIVLGHEFAGVVEAVGDGVHDIEVGERYVASMMVGCGACAGCQRQESRSCTYFGMFGMGPAFGDLQGGQAEYVRVPFADRTLIEQPAGVATNDMLMLTDILSTAWTALTRAGVRGGNTVTVVGAGPVGQLLVMCAPLFGASRVIAVDLDATRLRQAEELGAIPVNAAEVDPRDGVFDHTNNQGADVTIEAVGNAAALETALGVTRMAGTVVQVGTLVDEPMPWSAGEMFMRSVAWIPVLGEPPTHAEALTRLVAAGRLAPSRVVSHEMPLEDAPKAYELFDRREATKVVLTTE